jgi:hypothetical protein
MADIGKSKASDDSREEKKKSVKQKQVSEVEERS